MNTLVGEFFRHDTMEDYVLTDRDYHPLDRLCMKSADPDFKTALLTERPEALRAWCRKNPRKMHRALDWLHDVPANQRFTDLIDREIGRTGRIQGYWVSVILTLLGIAASVAISRCALPPTSVSSSDPPTRTAAYTPR